MTVQNHQLTETFMAEALRDARLWGPAEYLFSAITRDAKDQPEKAADYLKLAKDATNSPDPSSRKAGYHAIGLLLTENPDLVDGDLVVTTAWTSTRDSLVDVRDEARATLDLLLSKRRDFGVIALSAANGEEVLENPDPCIRQALQKTAAVVVAHNPSVADRVLKKACVGIADPRWFVRADAMRTVSAVAQHAPHLLTDDIAEDVSRITGERGQEHTVYQAGRLALTSIAWYRPDLKFSARMPADRPGIVIPAIVPQTA